MKLPQRGGILVEKNNRNFFEPRRGELFLPPGVWPHPILYLSISNCEDSSSIEKLKIILNNCTKQQILQIQIVYLIL
jgi:hypothetical protein